MRGTEAIDKDAVFELECEILVPAGLQNQIGAHNADRVQARLIAEAANGPITPEGDTILRDRAITIVPDILCNAGGMVIGYFEWVQDMQAFFWTEDEIAAELDRIMSAAYTSVQEMAEREHVDLRAVIVDVVFARDRKAHLLEQTGQRVAERRAAPVSDVERAGRIGRAVFDVDPLAAAQVGGPVVAPGRFRQHQRSVGRGIAVRRIARRLHRDALEVERLGQLAGALAGLDRLQNLRAHLVERVHRAPPVSLNSLSCSSSANRSVMPAM
jgi:hypothetical protein